MTGGSLLALDVSTTQTGYCIGAPNTKPRFGAIRPPASMSRTERIAYIAAEILMLAKAMRAKRVVMEQLSVTSYKRQDGTKADANFKSAEAMAECRGVIKHVLRPLFVAVTDANMQSARARLGIRASLGIEKGGVKKAHVLQWLRNHQIPVDNGDEADAIVIWLAVSLGKI